MMVPLSDQMTCLCLGVTITGILSHHSWHAIAAFLAIIPSFYLKWYSRTRPVRVSPASIEYNFHRQCNRSCNACINSITASQSHKLPLKEAKAGLRSLRTTGMQALEFAGEEPFLEPEYLGKLARYCKEVLGVESISVSTNGGLVKKQWLDEYGEYIDVLLVSCRSFTDNPLLPLERMARLCQICREYGIRFIIQTAVDCSNHKDDMNQAIQGVNPYEWICHPAPITGGVENADGLQNPNGGYAVTEEQFVRFCQRHENSNFFQQHQGRPNESLYLTEDLCFQTRGSEVRTRSILQVGVAEALDQLSKV